MKKNYFLFCLSITILSSLFLVCSSSEKSERFSKEKEEVSDNTSILKDSIPKRVETTLPEKSTNIKDTSTMLGEAESEMKKDLVFAVQLGAFKEIKNVEKFEKTVKKDFPDIFMKTEPDDATKTFKVTIGKFEDKKDAYKLRDYCVDKGYKDAWVITIPK